MTSDESTEPRQDTVRHALVVGIDDYAEVGWASLRGCVNDAELFHSLLVDRFDFDPERVILLRNREATRDGILAGFDRLEGAVDPGDVVVFFFAGHGSRILDPRDPQTFRESLVAQDSGRGSVEGDGSAGAPSSGAPNRDILDLEILGWTRRLNERTPHVTLIFDCCHSGAVSRTEAASELDGFAAATRELEPDLRDVEAMFGGKPPEVLRRSGEPPEVLRRGGDGVPEAAGDAGWPLGGRRGTVLAACRGDELAKELRKFEGGEVVHHGAFSYFLGKTLADSAGSVTWRDVYERAAPQVCSRYGDQHPQLEGRRDAVLFGIEDLPPAPYLRLRSLADGRAQLAGGAAHGVAPGSRWSVRAGATRHRASGLEVGTLTVETADATSSDGPFEGSPPEDPVAELRAFLVDRPPEDPLLRVAIHNASRTEGEAGAWRDVATHIADAPLLTATDDAADADVVLRQTPPGSGDSAEASGTWEALGNDLRPVARPRPDDATGRRGLVEDLGRVASFRNLLSLENPDRASPLREGIELRISGWDEADGRFVPAVAAAGDVAPRFAEGERAEIEIRNRSDRRLFVHLLQLGADLRVDSMLPFQGDADIAEGLPLEAGDAYAVAARYFDHPQGLPLRLPEGFPWCGESPTGDSVGTLYLKALATPIPTRFDFLEQTGTRPSLGHPLEQLVHLCARGGRLRTSEASAAQGDDDWTQTTVAIAVRR